MAMFIRASLVWTASLAERCRAMGDLKSELEALRAEVERLKPAPMPSEADVAAHRAAMHEASERRMANASAFTRDQLVAFQAAVPDEIVRGIVADGHAPIGPTGMVRTSQQTTDVRGGGRGTGWAREVPLGTPPGVAQADRLMDEQDRRDRHELISQEARRRAAEQLK
jgi:hypothetical protein